jgi:exopolysaccharide biosynthesis polyprenyl glycosylphosphotransferase
MLKQNWRLISRIEKLSDLCIVILSFIAAYHGRSSLIYWNTFLNLGLQFKGYELSPIKDYFIVLIVGVLGYMTALHMLGGYSSMRLSSLFRLIRITIVSSFAVFVLLSSILFSLRIDVSRSFIILFCATTSVLLLLERYCVLKFLRYWRRRGRNYRNVLICGIGAQALQIAKEIYIRPELGVGIRAFTVLHDNSSLPHEDSIALFYQNYRKIADLDIEKVIVGKENTIAYMLNNAIDEVIFTDVIDSIHNVKELIMTCSVQGIRTTLVADLFSLGMVKSGISYFGGQPLIHFQTPPGDKWELGLKRIIDFCIAVVVLILLAPILIVIAILIKIDSEGPVFFRQKRVGLNGRIFTLYKFRSMRNGAENELSQLSSFNEMSGPVFKMREDPRVTKVGRFLRRFSLDELPQFFNVFRGDMSIVGPRPPVPGEVSMYEYKDRRRLSMRPGITCIWQVSGRNDICDFQSWVKLDLEYIDNWSLMMDFMLLLKTIPAVLFGSGAR